MKYKKNELIKLWLVKHKLIIIEITRIVCVRKLRFWQAHSHNPHSILKKKTGYFTKRRSEFVLVTGGAL